MKNPQHPSYSALAKSLGVSEKTLVKWAKGTSKPDYRQLMALLQKAGYLDGNENCSH
jgi:DNA-binding transcriptional regulator YiaG